jgi:hypothetical protein
MIKLPFATLQYLDGADEVVTIVQLPDGRAAELGEALPEAGWVNARAWDQAAPRPYRLDELGPWDETPEQLGLAPATAPR